MSKKLDFDELANKALKNAEHDRKETIVLLNDLYAWVAQGQQAPGTSDKHKEVSLSLAKYVETLQRSNEQIVKIAIASKKLEKQDDSLKEEERNEIFEALQRTNNEE